MNQNLVNSKSVTTFCKLLAIAIILALSAPSHAGLVHIELIIFSHKSQSDEWIKGTQEILSVKKLNDLAELKSPDSGTPKLLPTSSTQLVNIAKVFDNHPDYDILNYLSWIQDTEKKSKTEAISLDIEISDQILFPHLVLSGTAILYEIGERLYFEIDTFYRPVPDIETEIVQLTEPIARLIREKEFSMTERRAVSINETHFFDHPEFGAILNVIRPPKPENFAQ